MSRVLRRCALMLPAVPLCACGVVLLVRAGLGLDPLSGFEYGLAGALGLPLGTASLLFEGCVFFLFLFIDRRLIRFGTAAFCFGIGPCMNLFAVLLAPLAPVSVAGRAACFSAGGVCITLAMAYYIPMDFGLQSLDMLAVTVARYTKRGYGTGLGITYLLLFAGGVALGAPWGVGTVVAVLLFGRAVDAWMKLTRKLINTWKERGIF